MLHNGFGAHCSLYELRVESNDIKLGPFFYLFACNVAPNGSNRDLVDVRLYHCSALIRSFGTCIFFLSVRRLGVLSRGLAAHNLLHIHIRPARGRAHILCDHEAHDDPCCDHDRDL